MSLKLYTYPNNSRAWKAQIAAQYNGVKIELPAFEMGKDNQSAEFLAKFPTGKVPALETPQGSLVESNAIAKYVAGLRADTGLLGNSHIEKAQVDQWIEFTNNEIDMPRAVLIYPILGYLKYNKKAEEDAKADIAKALKILNNHLLNHTYLVGNQVTLADIVVATTLVHLYQLVFVPEFIAPFGNVTRWFTTCINQTEFSAVIGKVEFAKAAAAPAKAEKKEEPKKEVKKEQPKKEQKAAEEEDLDEVPAPKKPKSELDLLPPTPIILDALKKNAFSERPIKPNLFEEILPEFDHEGWSFWISSYNYNSDNSVFFMTCNAVGGFLQRCDAVRKYAMGVMNITGKNEEEGPFTISGAWLFRGQEVPKVEMLSENPDSEYYTWTKVDIKSAEGLKKIKEQFYADEIDGLKVLERRFMK